MRSLANGMGSAGRVFLRRPLVVAIAALLLAGATQAATADRETAARFDMVRKIEVIARESSEGATPNEAASAAKLVLKRGSKRCLTNTRKAPLAPKPSSARLMIM